MSARIDAYEWMAGKLLVRAAKLRARRMAPEDAHELRHLLAAVTAGNSTPCERGRACHLDADLMSRLHDANWPMVHLPAASQDGGSPND